MDYVVFGVFFDRQDDCGETDCFACPPPNALKNEESVDIVRYGLVQHELAREIPAAAFWWGGHGAASYGLLSVQCVVAVVPKLPKKTWRLITLENIGVSAVFDATDDYNICL